MISSFIIQVVIISVWMQPLATTSLATSHRRQSSQAWWDLKCPCRACAGASTGVSVRRRVVEREGGGVGRVVGSNQRRVPTTARVGRPLPPPRYAWEGVAASGVVLPGRRPRAQRGVLEAIPGRGGGGRLALAQDRTSLAEACRFTGIRPWTCPVIHDTHGYQVQ